MIRDVTILIPALNEEKTIGKVIGESTERGWIVLVGDNNSTDRTREVAMSRGVTPISVPERGKGHTIRELISHIDTPKTIMIDADYTYPTRDAQRVLETLEGCDVVIGYRKYRERGSMPFLNVIGNHLLSLLASVLYGRRVHDICSGLWSFRSSMLKEFSLVSGGFTLEADLFVNVVRNKCRLKQIPIGYRARPDGSKPKLRISDGLKIGWFLIKGRFK